MFTTGQAAYKKSKAVVKRFKNDGDCDAMLHKNKYAVTAFTIPKEDVKYMVRKKFLIFRPEVLSAKLHYVPCWQIRMDFSIAYFKKSRSEDGSIEFIVDGIRGCGVIEEKLNLKFEKKALQDEIIVPDKMTEAQAEKKAIVDARWKVLLSRYKKPPELRTTGIKKFYRPYYEVEFTYGKKPQTQWVAADDFGSYFVYN